MVTAARKPELIHTKLQETILSGQLRVGDRLPTEPELAQEFGCSIGTISKAIALLVHDGLVERKPRTGTRVVQSTLASTPASTTLDAFAFIYPSALHEGSWRFLKGFQEPAKARDRRVITLTCGTDYLKEAEYISRLLEFDVCGAALSPMLVGSESYAHFCNLMLKCSIPIVLVGTHLHGIDCPAVYFDSFHASYSATKHLLDKGSRKIGFLCVQASIMRNAYNGYLWALEEAGITPQPNWVMREEAIHPNFTNPLEEPTRLGERFLKQCDPSLEAVMCGHDYLALGMIQAAKAAGKSVPGDLKVIGMDALEQSATAEVPLTTYQMPFEEVGRKCFEMLHALVTGDESYPRDIKLRGRIIERESA